jgi:diacylglycerol O-acyltransferase
MWRLERDPALSSTFASVTVLESPIDFETFCRRIERATYLVPRLRHRVQDVPANLAPPAWVDDPDFAIERHVTRATIAPPGDTRALLDLATEIAATSFDRRHPLWEFIVIDDLADGRGAIIQKQHHTIADGEASVKLSRQFVDFERDAPEPPPLTAEELADAVTPSPRQATPADQVRGLVEVGFRRSRAAFDQASEILRDPAHLPRMATAAVSTVRSLAKQLTDVEKARSPVWTARSLNRRFETLRAPLDPVRRVAKSLGGTLNTAFLTGATAAAGAYHRQVGMPVDELRASMAISTRTKESGANAFTLARFLVPTGDMDIAKRFQAVREVTEAVRSSSGGASLNSMAQMAAMLPSAIVGTLARQQTQAVDFATSNVRAAHFPLYIGGARIIATYPLGPLGGVAFNLTLLSYDGSLDMGVNIDTDAVTEPELLRTCLEESFAELVALDQ